MFAAFGLFVGIFMIISGVVEIVFRLINRNVEGFWGVVMFDMWNFLMAVGLVALMSLVITHGLLKDKKMGAGLFKKNEEVVVQYKTVVIQSDKIIYLEK